MSPSKTGEDPAVALVTLSHKSVSISEFVHDMKAKAWPSNDWTTQLGAAPVCLEMLGSCCMLAARPEAHTITLSPPTGGWKRLKGYKYLRPSLTQVVNQGRLCFLHARGGMESIKLNSSSVRKNVQRIIRALKSPEFEPRGVQIEMSVLNDAAVSCQDEAKKMYDEFDDWLRFIMELHEACQEEEGHTETLFQATDQEEQGKKLLEEATQEQIKAQQVNVTNMETLVNESRQQYKDALKEWPTGDKLMKQQLIMMGAQMAQTLVKGLTNALSAKFSPLSFLSGGNKDKDDEEDKPKSTTTPKDDTKKSPEGDKKYDPASARCAGVVTALEGLSQIVNGDDEYGVDWKLVVGGADSGETDGEGKEAKKKKKGSNLKIGTVKTLLKDSNKNIRKAPEEKASNTGKLLLKSLKEGIEVSTALEAQGEKLKDLKASNKPKKDSTTVKEWQKKTKDALKRTRKLRATADASNASTQTSTLFPDTEVQKAEVQSRTDLNSQTIEAARAKAASTLKAYQSDQEVLQKMNDTLFATQRELSNLQVELKSLANKKLALEDVRRVLRDCVLYLNKLKDNLATLILFFRTISLLIDAAVKHQVIPFKSYVEMGITSRLDGNLIKQLELETIYSYALNVAGNFELYVDIADMYIKVNDNHIAPGFQLVDEMSRIDDKETVLSRTMKLSQYSQDAQQGIRTIIKGKTDKLIEGYGSRIQAFENALADPTLPQLPPGDQEAIAQGAQEAQNAIFRHIETNNAPLKLLGQSQAVRDRHQEQLAASTNDSLLAQMELQRIRAEKEKIQAADADGEKWWDSD